MCPCGESCQNRKFQRHQNAIVYPINFGDKGFGLVAGKFIPKETFVIQYIGEVLSIVSEEGKKRLQDYSKSTCTYMMRLGAKEVIDPTYKGNMARFINHSCDPNCETRKWNVRGEIEVGIFTIKDIKEGEELTFDYKFDAFQTPYTRCLCGTAKCKIYLGHVPTEYTTEEWQEKIHNLACEICGSANESKNNQLLLCDNCNEGFHALCCNPPILSIPHGAWFCANCQSGINAPQPQPSEKTEEEKEPTEKPLKRILLNDKRLLTFYARQRKKNFGKYVPQRNRERDPEEAFLQDYNEFYDYQKELQFENICEIIDEIKQERRDALGLLREKSQVDRNATKYDGSTIDAMRQEELPMIEEEATEDESEFEILNNQRPQVEDALENKSIDEKIKYEISECFEKFYKVSPWNDKLKQKAFLQEINQPGETSRSVMQVSSIELSLFRNVDVLSKFITQNLTCKLFWNNSQAYHPDIFEKEIEFTITGTKAQITLVNELFKIMDNAVNWFKKISGFTKAIVKVPAIYLKRVLGEYQKNM